MVSKRQKHKNVISRTLISETRLLRGQPPVCPALKSNLPNPNNVGEWWGRLTQPAWGLSSTPLLGFMLCPCTLPLCPVSLRFAISLSTSWFCSGCTQFTLYTAHCAHFAVNCLLSVNCSVFFCNTHFCASISWQCRDFWSRVVFSVWLGGDHFVADFSRPAITLLARKPSQVQMHRNPVALKTIQLRSHDETWFHWNPAYLKQKMQGAYKKWSQINNRIGIKLIMLRGISCHFFQRKGEAGLSLPGVFWLYHASVYHDVFVFCILDISRLCMRPFVIVPILFHIGRQGGGCILGRYIHCLLQHWTPSTSSLL